MRKTIWTSFIFVALLFCLTLGLETQFAANENAGEASSRFGKWNTVGPNGGDVRSLAVDPKDKNRFYFGTLDGQIYTSSDAGKSWRLLVNFNRPQLTLDNLMVDPRDSKTIYASGHRHKDPGGFFKSTDGGLTWREAPHLKEEAIHTMTQSTANPDLIVVGTVNGVFQSFDSGNTFQAVKAENAPLFVDSVAIDPRNTDVLYAGTTWRAYKSTDAGKNWRLIKDGMIDDSDVFAIEIDPRNPDRIIASACSGIYDSNNAGEKWRKVQGIPSQSRRTRDIMLHPTKPGYIYAGTTEGFWMSSDNGAKWTLTTSQQLEVNSIEVHPDAPEKIYIGTNNYGVMVSNDYGKTFTMTNGGFSARLTYQIVADVENPNRFYSATHNTATGGGFFFVSNDGGQSWQASMKNFPTRLIAYSILQDRGTPNTIYLGTNFGVYRSLDRGASWAAVTAPKVAKPAAKKPAARKPVAKKGVAKPAAKPVAKTAEVKPVVPAAKQVAAITEKINSLAPTNDGKNGMFAATEAGLYRTYDIAQGWERLDYGTNFDAHTTTVAVAPQEPSRILVGTTKSGVLISRDAGLTWKQDEGVPATAPVSHIEINPERSAHIYVGTKQTVYITRDGGNVWQRRGGGLPMGDYQTIVVNPNNPNEIFAGSAMEGRDGLFQSLDGGTTWARVDSKDASLASRRVWAVVFDPKNSGGLLVGSHSGGIYRIEKLQTAAAIE